MELVYLAIGGVIVFITVLKSAFDKGADND